MDVSDAEKMDLMARVAALEIAVAQLLGASPGALAAVGVRSNEKSGDDDRVTPGLTNQLLFLVTKGSEAR